MKISRINPSDRLISQKTTFQRTLHKTNAYTWASQPILSFISIHVFFHTVSACASKLRERIEIMVYVFTSFFGGELLVQQGPLLFDRKKKLIWISPVVVGGNCVNLLILSVPGIIGASSISLVH